MKTKRLTLYSLVTALYVLLSLGFAELSFGPFQFRVAELLNLFRILSTWKYDILLIYALIFYPLSIP